MGSHPPTAGFKNAPHGSVAMTGLAVLVILAVQQDWPWWWAVIAAAGLWEMVILKVVNER